jgi:hypothetical protein
MSAADFQPGMSRTRQLATLEHMTTQSQGGNDNPRNTVMTCRDCNGRRGTMDAYEFYRIRSNPENWMAWLMKNRALKRQLCKEQKEKTNDKHHRLAYHIALLCILDPQYKELFDNTKVAVDQAYDNYQNLTAKNSQRRVRRKETLIRAEIAVKQSKTDEFD